MKKKTTLRSLLVENIVTLMFVVICVIGLYWARQPFSFVISEIMTRLFRNLVLILSLLVPVWAGMGLNFSIVLGAMAAQIGIIIVTNFSLSGVGALSLAFLISVPFSVGFGILTGKLFNRTKGQEMITGMILGFFAKGLYDLVFMFLCGPVIPIRNKALLLTNGIGLITPITLDKATKGAVNKLWRISLDKFLNVFLILLVVAVILYVVVRCLREKKGPGAKDALCIGGSVLLTAAYFVAMRMNQTFAFALAFVDVPMVTLIIIVLCAVILVYLSRTKLGSDISAVGQNRGIAEAMGIPVDRIRIISIVISTVLAGLGQLIFIQDIGNFTTYTAHENVGTFAIAALLVGGASVSKATIGQVVLGALLFHTIFIISPLAGKNIFNDAQIGEYFRVFASYAVIAIALALHAWKTIMAKREQEIKG